MQNNPKYNLEANKTVDMLLLYDNCLTGNSKYGEYFLYTVEIKGQAYSFFAVPELHNALKNYSKGTELTITKFGSRRGNKLVYTYDVKVKTNNNQVGNNHGIEEEKKENTDMHTRKSELADSLYHIMLESISDAIAISKQINNASVDVNKLGISLYISRAKYELE